MMPYDADADPVLRALVAEGVADPDVIGVVLHGSRSLGSAAPDSDYDIVFVVTDAAFERYERSGTSPKRGQSVAPPLDAVDLGHAAPSGLRLEQLEYWTLPGWADARVLFDRSGEVTQLLDALRRMPEHRARSLAAGAYDAYLNALYRSLKAWRRGDELGGRLQAAHSVDHLLAVLYALERRWRPYSDRLRFEVLNDQGWRPGELRSLLLDLLATGDPHLQQALGTRVTALLRARGYGQVEDDWNGRIAAMLEWTFPPHMLGDRKDASDG